MVNLKDYKGKKVHFIGIGGCSMSGLAQIMNANGYIVSGSDIKESSYTSKLAKVGIPYTIGQSKDNIADADLAIYTAAIKPTNPEYAYAASHNIPLIERSQLLGMISSTYEDLACISGCHGKTTITSMLARIMHDANKDCTVHVGGVVDFLDGGVKLGKSSVFITEACEYVKSFLTMSPKYILINNIDDDHLDCYKDINEICDTFAEFAQKLPKDGVLILNTDDKMTADIANKVDCKIITYGLEGNTDWTLKNFEFDTQGNGSADAFKHGKLMGRISLNVPGKHNLMNALAASIYACDIFGIGFETCESALKHYHLAGRRFELMGENNGVKIFHDYAHHPSEIKACLDGAKLYPHKKLWVVFQCNSYTRAMTLKEKYGTSFGVADEVLVPDIYPGRDAFTDKIHARDLVDEINKNTGNAKYLASFEEIKNYLFKNWQEGDIVVTLGSGDINKQQLVFLERY